jgi:hypothetical protein
MGFQRDKALEKARTFYYCLWSFIMMRLILCSCPTEVVLYKLHCLYMQLNLLSLLVKKIPFMKEMLTFACLDWIRFIVKIQLVFPQGNHNFLLISQQEEKMQLTWPTTGNLLLNAMKSQTLHALNFLNIWKST